MTTAPILELARAALEDDRRATPGPWTCRHLAWVDDRAADDGGELEFCDVPEINTIPGSDGYYSGRDDCEAIAAARTREPALARWIVEMLGARSTPLRVNNHDRIVTIEEHAPKMDGSHVLARLSSRQARATAAELLRAADEAEEK